MILVFVLDPSVHCAVHQQITRYKLLKKRLLLTFCVVDMLIIVTELDRLLKIGPLQLSIAVSGWYLLSRYDSHGNLQMSQNPPLKNDFSGYAWCDNTTSVSVAGQTIVETTFSRKKHLFSLLHCSVHSFSLRFNKVFLSLFINGFLLKCLNFYSLVAIADPALLPTLFQFLMEPTASQKDLIQ